MVLALSASSDVLNQSLCYELLATDNIFIFIFILEIYRYLQTPIAATQTLALDVYYINIFPLVGI